MQRRLRLTALIGGIVLTIYTVLEQDDAGRQDFRITTAKVTRGDIIDEVRAHGTLNTHETVQVGAQVTGRVVELLADYNDIVHRGDVLARLDPAAIDTQIAEARANLTRAEIERNRLTASRAHFKKVFERAEDLMRRQLMSQADFDSARLALRVADAQLRSAEAQVEQAGATLQQRQIMRQHTVIRAPIDGVVIARRVDLGQTVSARMQAPVLFVLAERLTTMQAIARVSEAEISKVRSGQPVTFRVDAYPQEAFAGIVERVRINPIRERGVMTYGAVVSVPNPDLKLRPGMTADVSIRVAERRDVVRIPAAASLFSPTPAIAAALVGDEAAPAAGEEWAEDLPSSDAMSKEDFVAAMQDPRTDAAPIADNAFDGDVGPELAAATGGEDTLWLMDDGEVIPVPVVLGISDGEQTELLAGDLQPGDEVVWNVTDAARSVRPEPTMRDFFRNGRSRR